MVRNKKLKCRLMSAMVFSCIVTMSCVGCGNISSDTEVSISEETETTTGDEDVTEAVSEKWTETSFYAFRYFESNNENNTETIHVTIDFENKVLLDGDSQIAIKDSFCPYVDEDKVFRSVEDAKEEYEKYGYKVETYEDGTVHITDRFYTYSLHIISDKEPDTYNASVLAYRSGIFYLLFDTREDTFYAYTELQKIYGGACKPSEWEGPE